MGRSTGRWGTFKRIMASVVIASASAGASVMLAPVTAQAASACAPTNTPAIADNNPGWVDGVYASGGDNDSTFGGVANCGNAQGQPLGGAPDPNRSAPSTSGPSHAVADPPETVLQRATSIMNDTYSGFMVAKRSKEHPFDWRS